MDFYNILSYLIVMGLFDRFKKKEIEKTEEKTQEKSSGKGQNMFTPVYIGLKSKIDGKQITINDIFKGVGIKAKDEKNKDIVDFILGKPTVFVGGNIGFYSAIKGNDFVVVVNFINHLLLDVPKTLQSVNDPRVKKLNLLQKNTFDVAMVGGADHQDIIGVYEIKGGTLKYHWKPNCVWKKSDFEYLANKKTTHINEIPWKPKAPVQIKKIIDKSVYYVNPKYPNVVFSNGTIVAITNNSKDIKKTAIETLSKIVNYHMDFRVNNTDDGNFLVSYNDPAFSIVFSDELKKYKEDIIKNVKNASPDHEVLLYQGKVDNVNLLVGLLGRARLWQDFMEKKIVNTHKGK